MTKLYLAIILQLIFNPFLSAKNEEQYDIAICAIFQNEAPYLKEWIEFHRLVGVKHFYLFNNLSTDEYQAVLDTYIHSGLVELISWPYEPNKSEGWNRIQCNAYNHALKLACGKVKWLAVLDVDEFLFPVKAKTLSEFLLDYEFDAGLAVNWQMYGTSDIDKLPPGHLMIESLLMKAQYDYEENVHVKSIVRPKLVEKFKNPHYAIFRYGFYAVNSNHKKVTGAYNSPILIDKIRINHYWTRDAEFFNRVKVPRREIWKDGGCWERLNNLNQESDPAILKYVPELKKSL